MHAVKRRNRTHEIHNLHKTHRPRSAKCFPSLLRRARPSFSCLSILAKANMLKQLKLCFRPGPACAGATERAFCKVAGRLKKSFRRPTCHAYDYAALIVPTAVCICIGMHAVKRRNRTHEIHNLHKTHRRDLCKMPFRSSCAGAWPELLQLFEHFGESQHAQTTEAVLQAGLLPAQERRKGHFAKVAGRLKKGFRRPLCAMRTITLR